MSGISGCFKNPNIRTNQGACVKEDPKYALDSMGNVKSGYCQNNEGKPGYKFNAPNNSPYKGMLNCCDADPLPDNCIYSNTNNKKTPVKTAVKTPVKKTPVIFVKSKSNFGNNYKTIILLIIIGVIGYYMYTKRNSMGFGKKRRR